MDRAALYSLKIIVINSNDLKPEHKNFPGPLKIKSQLQKFKSQVTYGLLTNITLKFFYTLSSPYPFLGTVVLDFLTLVSLTNHSIWAIGFQVKTILLLSVLAIYFKSRKRELAVSETTLIQF
jgi:hypothetical protein